MIRKKLLALALIGSSMLSTNVASTNLNSIRNAVSSNLDGENVTFTVRNINQSDKGFPDTKSPILIPEVTMDGHTLHFITPCTGLTLQLVQDDEVCYETVITSDYLEIPSSITGVYELQILRGDYVFFAEIII